MKIKAKKLEEKYIPTLADVSTGETFSFRYQNEIYILDEAGDMCDICTGNSLTPLASEMERPVTLRPGSFFEDGWLSSTAKTGDVVEIDGLRLRVLAAESEKEEKISLPNLKHSEKVRPSDFYDHVSAMV